MEVEENSIMMMHLFLAFCAAPPISESILVNQLGSESFVAREHAQKVLLQRGIKVIPSVVLGKTSSDPEIRVRSKRIHEALWQEHSPSIYDYSTTVHIGDHYTVSGTIVKSTEKQSYIITSGDIRYIQYNNIIIVYNKKEYYGSIVKKNDNYLMLISIPKGNLPVAPLAKTFTEGKVCCVKSNSTKKQVELDYGHYQSDRYDMLPYNNTYGAGIFGLEHDKFVLLSVLNNYRYTLVDIKEFLSD